MSEVTQENNIQEELDNLAGQEELELVYPIDFNGIHYDVSEETHDAYLSYIHKSCTQKEIEILKSALNLEELDLTGVTIEEPYQSEQVTFSNFTPAEQLTDYAIESLLSVMLNELKNNLLSMPATPTERRNLYSYLSEKKTFRYDEVIELHKTGDFKTVRKDKEDKEDKAPATIKQSLKIKYPLDPINRTIWKLFPSENLLDKTQETASNENNIIELKIASTVTNIVKLPVALFSDYDKNTTISKDLTPYDKLVYFSIATLYDANKMPNSEHVTLTLRQIYMQMGGKNNINQDAKNKINASIQKMRVISITTNNEEEHAASSGGKRSYSYKEHILDIKSIEEFKSHGGVSDSAICVLARPVLLEVADQRKELTTIPLSLLQSDIKKTDYNLNILYYLYNTIILSREHDNHKLLFSTVYKNVGTTRKNKARTKQTIIEYLELLCKGNKTQEKIISSYTINEETGLISWTFPRNNLKKSNKNNPSGNGTLSAK